MRSNLFISASAVFVLAGAAPAPHMVYGPDSQVSAVATAPPGPGQSGAAPPRVSDNPTGVTSHGPFYGKPTVTGAVTNKVLAASIAPLGPNPTATYYNAQGVLLNDEPAPYTPKGMFELSFFRSFSDQDIRWTGYKWHATQIHGEQ